MNGGGDAEAASRVQEAIDTLKQMIAEFNLNEIGVAFNGGKDCCILLHLLNNVLGSLKQLRVIHFESDDEFDEVKRFVKETEVYYGIEIELVHNGVKQGLQTLQEEGNAKLAAVVIGVRRTDPYCADLKPFQKTDHGWPQLIRVSPMLNWTYDLVWRYIDEHSIPVCSLYSKGYTSLGDCSTTAPNPKLLNPEDGSYRHARELINGDENERLGRK